MRFESTPDPREQIGVGGYKRAYKVVRADGTPEVQLVMKHQYTNEQMKGLFYLNKIATLLFPGKIAAVKQGGNIHGDDGQVVSSQFVSHYVEPDAQHRDIQEFATQFDGDMEAAREYDESHGGRLEAITNDRYDRLYTDNAIEAFRAAYAAAGLSNPDGAVQIGWGAQDVVFTKDGDFTFVDVDVPWDEPEDIGADAYTDQCLRFVPAKLQEAINTLPEPERTQTLQYYVRLEEQMRLAGFVV